jgi:heterodisulfide reductase subunit A-like polyferredoxin
VEKPVKAFIVGIFLAVVMTGCAWCVPDKVKQVAIEGDTAAARMVEFIDAGQVPTDKLIEWARADRALWGRMKEACEE